MDEIQAAAGQAWPAFVLILGLLLLGRAAATDGLFEVLGARLERIPGGNFALLGAMLAAVAVTTALLNLDTAVVFLTPVALHAARRRGLDEAPFLYGTVFMANAASLPLPGSNLTNLLLLERIELSGAAYAQALAAPALAAILVTGAGVAMIHRRVLSGAPRRSERAAAPVRLRSPVASAAALLAVVPILVLENPALVVLALGLAVTVIHAARRRTALGSALRSVAPMTTGGLFVLSVGFGALARLWSAPGELLGDASAATTAAVAAIGSVTMNNLPAAVVFSAEPPEQIEALLIGLAVGPNLAVTGSLSALLWWRAARATGARPSALAFSRQGLVLAPLAIAISVAAAAAT